MGWNRRKNLKEIGYVEAAVYLKRGENYLNSKYLIQFIDLFYVSFPAAKGGQDETRTDSKGLSIGWWGS